MTAWKTARLESFCTVGAGGTPSRDSMQRFYEGGNIPWVKSGELRETIIHDTEEHITEAALRETNVKMVPAGALLLAMYGATVGRLGTLGVPATTNQAVCHIIPDPKVAEVRYLFYAICNQMSKLVARSVGGAQPNISQGIVKDLAVPLPSLLEQRRIAEILDKADVLRAKRRAALAHLDTLTQSILLDMFGDPATNPKGWPVRAVGDMVVGVTNGMTRRRLESDTGTNIVLRLRDIRAGWIDFSDVNRITLTSEESSRYEILPGDILFIRVNGNPDYVGRCALFSGYTEPVYFNDHIMRVTLDHSVVNGVFLTFILNGPHGKREIASHRKTSAGQHTINQDGFSRIRIPLPSLHLQGEFVRCVNEIEKLRNTYRPSLIGLDEFFHSLQHRAFRGEL